MDEEETNLSANSIKNEMELEDKDVGENEEFYEDIEAPKFVDFTVPDNYRPDDRYWFCLRFGCDQKHEEEIDPEAIYKNFVLRVMAARSPNVRLHKALNRNCSSKNMKCPLSAPPKSSKPRLSRLAVISSISKKIGDEKDKLNKHLPRESSTPKAKGRQVASKYLITPGNKKCIQNLNVFLSVQNQKLSSVAVPKSRTVVKALNFQSPKKAISLKKSIEFRTPLTKLCEGMKKLEIASQRKPVFGYSSKQSKQVGNNPEKSLPLHSSTRGKGSNKEKCRTNISEQLHTQIDHQDDKPFRSLKGKSKGKLSKQSSIKDISCAREIKVRSRDYDKEHPVKEAGCPISNMPRSTNLASFDTSKGQLNNSLDSAPTNMGGDDLPRLQISNKEDDVIQEMLQEDKSETAHGDDKENASAFDENRSFYYKKDHPGRQILGMQNSNRKKVDEVVNKDLKGHATIGTPGMKLMKLKPTNPKPFRLRTDERGILREAKLERKNHDIITPQKEAAVVSRFQGGDLHGIQKGIAAPKPAKQQVRTKTPTGLRVHQSKQQLKPTTPNVESDINSKKTKSSSRHALWPQRHLSVTTQEMTPHKPLRVAVATSSGNSQPKKVGKPSKKHSTTSVRNRVPAGSSSNIKGKGLVTNTIPQETNLHRSHMPNSCAGKIS
ncbi:hypothetical protein ACH5RR_002115 [Cinchona calisaya]|uniref:Uncharacterized protein n=1 Tax=Cinchona calisaya TaxID=153742 RepID=A0ABD3B5M5_9GENT